MTPYTITLFLLSMSTLVGVVCIVQAVSDYRSSKTRWFDSSDNKFYLKTSIVFLSLGALFVCLDGVIVYMMITGKL